MHSLCEISNRDGDLILQSRDPVHKLKVGACRNKTPNLERSHIEKLGMSLASPLFKAGVLNVTTIPHDGSEAEGMSCLLLGVGKELGSGAGKRKRAE